MILVAVYVDGNGNRELIFTACKLQACIHEHENFMIKHIPHEKYWYDRDRKQNG